MNWFKSKSYPEFWNDYISNFDKAQNDDIDTLRFIVFDTETTGLDVKKDRILSIGCVGIENGQIKVADQLEVYVEQDHFVAETVKIHGLLKQGKHDKLKEKVAIEGFLGYIKNSVLVAHHAAFDVAMINAALQRHGLPKLKNKVLDTGYLFTKTKPQNSTLHYSLDELAESFNIPKHDRHTASGDAYITALLFLKIAAKLNTKSLKNLMRIKRRFGLL